MSLMAFLVGSVVQSVSDTKPLPTTNVTSGGVAAPSGIVSDPIYVTGSYTVVDVDSTGGSLPASFDTSFGRNGAFNVVTETRTNATPACGTVGTWVQTTTRDGSERVTAISKWIKTA